MQYGWRFPSHCGDLALIGVDPSEGDPRAKFKVMGADVIETERESLRKFVAAAQAKGWKVSARIDGKDLPLAGALDRTFDSCVVMIWADPQTQYPEVAALLGRDVVGVTQTLTAVLLSDGEVQTTAATPSEIEATAAKATEGTWWDRVKSLFSSRPTDKVRELALAVTASPPAATAPLEAARGPVVDAPPPQNRTPIAPAKPAKAAPSAAPAVPVAAVTTARPTNCCPYTIPGNMPDLKADNLLLAFCTPEQRESWTTRGYIEAKGQITGDTYRIAHRHSPVAVEQGKAMWCLTQNALVHCHLTQLPPAEEVLSIKLAVEHRESWIRNPSTLFDAKLDGADSGDPRALLPHPFQPERKQAADGLREAGFMTALAPTLVVAQKVMKSLTAKQ